MRCKKVDINRGDKMTKFQELMNRAGLTQAETAEKLGVSRSTIINYCIGRTSPQIKELSKISILFGCKEVDFIEPNPIQSPAKKK